MYTVYLHVNKINNKRYFGQTCQKVNLRWGRGSTYRNSIKFYNAILKYGWDNFNHFEIANGLSKEEADALECKLIGAYNTNTDGYNICEGGAGVMKGRRHTSIARDKIQKARLKQKFSLESQKTKAFTQLGFSYYKIQVTFEDGNIRNYDLVSEIADELSMSKAHISKCLNGIRKSHLKCTFKYIN